ncbi:putative phage head-tail adaptor [Anaerofustis stercorihominis DSM 17244]|uniref:Phage head-tail adaptor n=1 Tax=Anaerofustis stercorihominis DSM 17244 TaxID=445971 RepID=B1C725_9FIRM|nr:helix-turn-helix transcriptional regulator [Anaerofustis stercorihominis]EDS72812.1 putative phage head-tail adaptor [Anaerofustis stercorihominis DSM 17244]
MKFSQKLKQIRKKLNLSQEQFAEKIGVSRQAITKWETEGGIADIDNIIRIPKEFDISIDELLKEEKNINNKKDFLYSSETKYDIENIIDYDININEVSEVVLKGVSGEKIIVKLASNTIDDIEKHFKVKIDENKRSIDVEIKKIGEITMSEAKDELSVLIYIPYELCNKIEIYTICDILKIQDLKDKGIEADGKFEDIFVYDYYGHLELNCSNDMNITYNEFNGRIDINQIKATSKLNIPTNSTFNINKKGRSNNICFNLNNQPTEEIELIQQSKNLIELSGIGSELIINKYTK